MDPMIFSQKYINISKEGFKFDLKKKKILYNVNETTLGRKQLMAEQYNNNMTFTILIFSL